MENLGINWQLLVAQLAGFLILLALLSIFAFPRIRKTLDERSERIRDSLEQAERIKKETVGTEERIKESMDNARQEAQKIVAQADELGRKVKEEAKDEARKEAEAILARAQDEIRLERDQAISELRKEVIDIAILAAEKVINKSLDDPAHRSLIGDVLEESGKLKKG